MTDKICPVCKSKLSDYYKTGMLTCPYCYTAFKSEIKATLINFQGGNFHTGKTPQLSEKDREDVLTYKRLIKEKEKAGLEGRFSDMAILSEKINELYESLISRGLL